MGEKGDWLDVYKVVHVGRGSKFRMITDDWEMFILDNLECESAGRACGAPHIGGVSKNRWSK